MNALKKALEHWIDNLEHNIEVGVIPKSELAETKGCAEGYRNCLDALKYFEANPETTWVDYMSYRFKKITSSQDKGGAGE